MLYTFTNFFLSVKQHKFLGGKMSIERNQVPEQKNFQSISATSDPATDYIDLLNELSIFCI